MIYNNISCPQLEHKYLRTIVQGAEKLNEKCRPTCLHRMERWGLHASL
jgi:hypothetical protein